MSKCFIVLGMHRTASSLLANGLKQAGINMGDDLLGPGRGNKKGHFEDVDFLKMNERILFAAGGSWDNPPSEKAILEAGKANATGIQKLVEQKSKGGSWGWKDPRTVLTIKCYIPFLNDPFFLVCLRDPEFIAESLKVRDGTSIEFGMELAGIYNERLLAFLNERS